jgi:DNA-binding CsgD family transcriptional regulator
LPDLSGHGLSKREADVVWLLIDGKSRKEVALLLDISQNTVNTYCRRIFDKTGSTSLAELTKKLGIIAT